MKKGQIRTGVVRNVKFPNRAMVVLEPLEGAADGEEICEVKGALPGQKISVVITKVRKGKGEGRLKEILEKSPIETVGVENGGCPHFNICGGCSYISMPYEESLKIKKTRSGSCGSRCFPNSRASVRSSRSVRAPFITDTAIRWNLRSETR